MFGYCPIRGGGVLVLAPSGGPILCRTLGPWEMAAWITSTYRTAPHGAKVLVSRNLDLADSIRELGFEVIGVGDGEEYALSRNARCRIIGTHSADTLMAISDGRETCINLNDALHSAPAEVQDRFIALLKRLYPSIDYVFCGYGVASHFPNCYEIPGKDRERTAAMRQAYFNRQWVKIIQGLGPRFGFPFAADVVFFEDDLFWANEPIHNSERPTQVFTEMHPESATQVLDIAPGFSILEGKVEVMKLRERIRSTELARTERESIDRANRYGNVNEAAVADVANLLRANIETCRPYLSAFEVDYRFLVRFRNGAHAIVIEKDGAEVSLSVTAENRIEKSYFDVIYTTRLAYLKVSLTTPYGQEILFVGSGGIFEYTRRVALKRRLHGELMVLLKRQDACPPPRKQKSTALVFKIKRVAKKLLGRDLWDLYDLERWTVFHS